MKPKTFLLFLLAILYFGCNNDDTLSPSNEIQGSLFITVLDPNGLPVKGANIEIGDLSAITDDDGTYFFTHATLTGDDYMEVEKAGYFKGSRRFATKESHTQFIRITLLPQAEVGNFSGAQSATISIDSKSSLTFPANAITRTNGTAYTGNVRVLASPIYRDDPLLSEKMPGDLTAFNQSGEKVVLSSLGMLGVELQADNGEVLQIASGKTVDIQFAISNQQVNNAPSTIPLWYFDEMEGYWVQEGEAVRQGNVYIGQVPHFSWWNWDIPNTFVDWEARFVYPDGRPAQNVRVCLTILSMNDQRCANTNADGVILGPVPVDEVMVLNVLNDCGTVMLTVEMGPFSDDVKMDAMVVDVSEMEAATISGTALQCDGTQLTNGYVRVRTPKDNFIYPILDAEGHFEGEYVFCTGDIVTLYVYDVTNSLVSFPRVLDFDRNLNVGSIKACDEPEEYLRYKITGFTQEYIYYLLDVENTNFHITKISTLDSIGVKGKFAFTFDGVTTGQYAGHTLFGNQINLPNGQVGYVVEMDVNITEYDGPGEYIKGNISGKINKGGNGAGGNGWSDFSGSFSVKNE